MQVTPTKKIRKLLSDISLTLGRIANNQNRVQNSFVVNSSLSVSATISGTVTTQLANTSGVVWVRGFHNTHQMHGNNYAIYSMARSS